MSVLDLLNDDALDGIVSFMEFFASRTRDLDAKIATVRAEAEEVTQRLQAVSENLKLRLGKAGSGKATGTSIQRWALHSVLLCVHACVRACVHARVCSQLGTDSLSVQIYGK